VATIGPASSEPEVLVRMVAAGMDVARLNFSHGTAEQHAQMAQRVRDAAGRAGRPVAILQDLPGPKLRIGPVQDDVVELTPGEHLVFACNGEELTGDAHRMSIGWRGLPDAVEKGSTLYLSDGAVLFYAQDEANATLQAHRAAGGRVAFVRNGHVVLAQGGEEMPLLGLDKVKPATAAQPDAVLAAALAGWALDVPTDLICAGLRTFDAAAKKGKA